jgi:hypothetical protein
MYTANNCVIWPIGMNIRIILSRPKAGFGLGRRCAFGWLSMLMSFSPYPRSLEPPSRPSLDQRRYRSSPGARPRSFQAWFALVMKLYVSRRTQHWIIFLCKQFSHLKHRWSQLYELENKFKQESGHEDMNRLPTCIQFATSRVRREDMQRWWD